MQAEQQLRASLKEIEDLKAALDEHAIVAITDSQGKITYVNDNFCAISKYSRAELLGQDHRIINSAYHSKEFIRELWTTIGHGKVWKGEIKNKAKDGSFYWVDTTVVPFLNEQGKPRQYVAIRADITERKRVEDQLRASLNEVNDLKAALDEHAIVAMTDSQGRITFVNDKFCAISKYSREELIGQDHRIINSGFHPAEFFRELWTTIANGKVWKGEIKNKAKDGSFYWVDTTIVPFLNEQGKPRQYVAIRADITERKRAEEASRKSEAQLQTIVESLDEGVVVSDLTGQLLHFNRAALAMHGFDNLEEGLRRLPEFADTFELSALDGTVWPVDQWPLARILRGETFRDLEVHIQRIKNGCQRIFSYGGTFVHDAAGQPLMAVVTIRDITERKRAEAEIRQLNAELEQRVIERTTQLETANKELESFSYSVSHDLRAPLRAVNGFAKIVLDTYTPQLPAEAREYLEEIRAGGERMGQLIDDLLAFSRLGRHALKSQPVETARLVQHVLNVLVPQRGERPIEIKIGELPGCLGDPALLKQVWLNLISNAIKYTSGRTPAVIEIGCVRKDDEAVFYVRDNGAGFDMRYAHKLFGVFQRLHRTEEFEGTGVGLAIVQRIIHRHGGQVWAEAEVGRGAIFRFTLEKGELNHESNRNPAGRG